MPDDERLIAGEAAFYAGEAMAKWRSHRASAASSGLISGGGHSGTAPTAFIATEAFTPDPRTAYTVDLPPMTSEEYQRLTNPLVLVDLEKPLPENIGVMGNPPDWRSDGNGGYVAVEPDPIGETLKAAGFSADVYAKPVDDSDLPATRGWVRDLLGEENLRIMLSNYAKAELLK